LVADHLGAGPYLVHGGVPAVLDAGPVRQWPFRARALAAARDAVLFGDRGLDLAGHVGRRAQRVLERGGAALADVRAVVQWLGLVGRAERAHRQVGDHDGPPDALSP